MQFGSDYRTAYHMLRRFMSVNLGFSQIKKIVNDPKALLQGIWDIFLSQ